MTRLPPRFGVGVMTKDENTNKDNEDVLAFLYASLNETQSTVRAYDTKAQIVGIGYIFALGIVFNFAAKLASPVLLTPTNVALAWIFIVVPIILFGAVLYPTRKIAPALKRTGLEDHGCYYARPGQHSSPEEFLDSIRKSNLEDELAYEVLKVAGLRDLKRKRFLRALWAATISFSVLFVSQLTRAFELSPL